MTASSTKSGTKIVYLGLLLALSLILSYVENLIPLSFSIPGIKLGLSNFPVVVTLFVLSPLDALILSTVKALFGSILFGNLFACIYSLTGALISCIFMIALTNVKKLHAFSISAVGGIMHNVGQFCVAFLVLKSDGLLYYLPFLLLSGFVCGLLLGIVAYMCIPYILRWINSSSNQLVGRGKS